MLVVDQADDLLAVEQPPDIARDGLVELERVARAPEIVVASSVSERPDAKRPTSGVPPQGGRRARQRAPHWVMDAGTRGSHKTTSRVL